MIPTVDQLKTTLAALPVSDRAELAHYLLTSLDEANDDGDETSWQDELNRRIEEVRSGKAIGIPLESVLDELRQRHP